MVVPNFTYSIIHMLENGIYDGDKIGRKVSVNSIFRTRLRWSMEVVSGIMRIVVPIPPTHPRCSTPVLTIDNIEITVRVNADLEDNLLNCVRKVLTIKLRYDRFRTFVRKDRDRFNE
jgi:hypothetical protein